MQKGKELQKHYMDYVKHHSHSKQIHDNKWNFFFLQVELKTLIILDQ